MFTGLNHQIAVSGHLSENLRSMSQGHKRRGWQHEAPVSCEWDFTERRVTAQTTRRLQLCFCTDFLIS